jgi:DNA-binding transcriptional LysR family regulator
MAALSWECVGKDNVVVVLPARHPLAKKKVIKRIDLQTFFFVAMSEDAYPGAREWLNGLCQQVGFTPRILHDADLESGIMTFIAEGLGVTLAREQIKKLPHTGVAFRPLAVPAKAEYWVAWHRDNRSKGLHQFIDILKNEATAPTSN